MPLHFLTGPNAYRTIVYQRIQMSAFDPLQTLAILRITRPWGYVT
jgi:hypothetical protein